MNNPNYNQQPYQQQPYQQQPYQQQPAPMPPTMPPQPPKAPKAPFFNNDMLAILACTASLLGFGLVLASFSVYPPAYGLIINILAILFSAGGCFLSFIFGNQRIATGAPRGTVCTLGLIFGLAGFVIGLFAIFSTGCVACTYCKATSAVAAVKGLI